MRQRHRPGMKGCDLIVVGVGRDECLRSKRRIDGLNATAGNIQFAQAFKIRRTVLADGRHDQRVAAQQFQIVGNIAGATTELASHRRYQERDVDLMQVIGQQGFGKASVEGHDGVIGHRTANERMSWDGRLRYRKQGSQERGLPCLWVKDKTHRRDIRPVWHLRKFEIQFDRLLGIGGEALRSILCVPPDSRAVRIRGAPAGFRCRR